jgi:hypothetical protein
MLDSSTIDLDKLRQMTVGELIDGFEPGDWADLEPAATALIAILFKVIPVYDWMDCGREIAWALGIATLALEASSEETMNGRTAEMIARNIHGIAYYLLMYEGSENWDADTLKMLKTICNADDE